MHVANGMHCIGVLSPKMTKQAAIKTVRVLGRGESAACWRSCRAAFLTTPGWLWLCFSTGTRLGCSQSSRAPMRRGLAAACRGWASGGGCGAAAQATFLQGFCCKW